MNHSPPHCEAGVSNSCPSSPSSHSGNSSPEDSPRVALLAHHATSCNKKVCPSPAPKPSRNPAANSAADSAALSRTSARFFYTPPIDPTRGTCGPFLTLLLGCPGAVRVTSQWSDHLTICPSDHTVVYRCTGSYWCMGPTDWCISCTRVQSA